MKKKILITMMCLAMAGLTACGNKTEEAPAETAPVETETTETETTGTETTETETTGIEAASAEEIEVDGIVTDAAMNSLSIVTPESEFLLFSYPDEGIESDLEDGILLGEVVKVTYVEDENEVMVAKKVTKSGITVELPREAYEFALGVLMSIKFMDQETLASMVKYPVYVKDTDIEKVVESKEDFMALDREALFTEDFMMLGDYNLFEMESGKEGIMIGNTTPNITFNDNGDGTYAITGIQALSE